MRPRTPRYVQAVRSKGHEYLYFRRHGARRRLPDDPTSAAFAEAYVSMLSQTDADPAPRQILEGSVGALIRDYKSSDEYLALQPKTQRDYARMLGIFAPINSHPAESVRRRHIREFRTQLAGKARTQKLFTQVASALFNFAIDTDYVEANPASRMKRIGKSKSFAAWSNEECAVFEASTPATHLLTGYMIARYTGQRRGDILKMARSAYDGRSIELRQHKTDEHLVVTAHKRLKLYLDELPKQALLLVADEHGRPLDETTFSKQFPLALNSAGLPHLHFHGLRHTAGRALAEAGCSGKEIQAITGHRTLQMVEHYTRAAARKQLASSAIAKLEEKG